MRMKTTKAQVGTGIIRTVRTYSTLVQYEAGMRWLSRRTDDSKLTKKPDHRAQGGINLPSTFVHIIITI